MKKSARFKSIQSFKVFNPDKVVSYVTSIFKTGATRTELKLQWYHMRNTRHASVCPSVICETKIMDITL